LSLDRANAVKAVGPELMEVYRRAYRLLPDGRVRRCPAAGAQPSAIAAFTMASTWSTALSITATSNGEPS
jgi:hypothetical protein